MYKLMVVDDEKSIREGIARGIPWKEWGFSICGVCKNGEEAVKEMENQVPDVVLSDIRMPKMDGIELMKYVRETYPGTKVIILSGYKEFEYLNMSIRHQVTEYLLKPTDPDEFEEVFRRIKEKLDTERRERDGLFQEGADRKITRLLRECSGEKEKDVLKREIEEHYGIHLDYCRVAICKLDRRYEMHEDEQYRLRREMSRICNEEYEGIESCFWLYKDEVLAGILSEEGGVPDLEIVRNFLTGLQERAERELHISVTFGVSAACHSSDEIKSAIIQAEQSALQRVFCGYKSVFFYDLHVENGREIKDIALDYVRMEEAFLDNGKEIPQMLEEKVFSYLEGMPIKNAVYFFHICAELYFYLYRIAQKYGIDFEQIAYAHDLGTKRIQEIDSIEEVRRRYTAVALELRKGIQERIEGKREGNGTSDIIKAYVDREYTNNGISLEYLSKETGKSPAYISKLFKEETGCNFSEYVTRRRLEKSRMLLKDPRLKVYEIAERIGYADVSNYIRLFKKHYGISPRDFRNCIGGNRDEGQ